MLLPKRSTDKDEWDEASVQAQAMVVVMSTTNVVKVITDKGALK